MVTFRDWQKEDASALYELSKDLFLQKSWNHQYLYPSTIEDAQACVDFYLQANKDRFFIQAIIYHHKVCGYIQCEVKDYQKGELSYYLASTYHNHGIMTTLLPLFCHACFEHLSVVMLYARVDKNNVASQKVLLRNNFIEQQNESINIYIYKDNVIMK